MPPRAPSIAAIRRAVCREFGIREVVLIGRRRPEHICAPRHAAMYLARELTDASLNKIGREIGGRDHSTVADGVRATEIRMEFQAGFAERIGRLRRELTEASRD